MQDSDDLRLSKASNPEHDVKPVESPADPAAPAARDVLARYRHLIVFDNPSPEAGGIQNMAYWLARRLAARGLSVVFAGQAEHLTALRSIPGIELFAYRRAFRTRHTADLRLLLLLLRLRRRFGSRLVFYSMIINNIRVFRWLRWLLGWRAVSFLHGNETLRLFHRRPLTLRRNLLACDVVFANSRHTRSIAEGIQPFDNIVVVAPGIPFDAYRDERVPDYRLQHGWQGRRIVLMLSRLVRRKGHATVIRAVAALRRKHADLLLVIGGRGGYRQAIERMLDDAGMRDHAQLIGLVPEADKPALYRACDVFCMPSDEAEASFDTEGFGIAFLEAAAAGRIAIGSRSGGIADAVEDGASGFLVEPGNVAQLVEVLDRVLSTPEQFEHVREYARARAASFDWSIQADKMLAELAPRLPVPGSARGRAT